MQSQVRFNRVPGLRSGSTGFREGSGEGLGQVRFNKVREQVPEKVWKALAWSQVRFNRVPENVPVKVWEALVQSQVTSTGFWRRFQEALVQSQVRLNRVPEKGEGQGGFGAEPGQVSTGLRGLGQVQQGSGEGSGEGLGQVRLNRVPEKVPEKVWDALVQSQVRFNRICGHLYNSWKPS